MYSSMPASASASASTSVASSVGVSKITVERRLDGSSVASELYANYPCRLHLITPPAPTPAHDYDDNNDDGDDDNESNTRQRQRHKALIVYILGYGGGLISGDTIHLCLTLHPYSSLLVTSQSTSKVFKAISDRRATCVQTECKVGRGALLVLCPQPLQCFGGSRLRVNTNVIMNGSAKGEKDMEEEKEDMAPSLLLVDWYTGGRHNLDGGVWQLDSFHSETTISYSGIHRHSHNRDVVKEMQVEGDKDTNSKPAPANKVIFRDAVKLSGGDHLVHHMRDFNVVCMVVLIGPRVQKVAEEFMKKYSSRHTYDDESGSGDDGGGDGDGGGNSPLPSFGNNPAKNMDYNRGIGLNRPGEGLLVSCGTFNTCQGMNGNGDGSGGYEEGVVVRLASTTLEIAAKFLSKHIGTLGGQLEDDPFLEILQFKVGVLGDQISDKNNDDVKNENSNGRTNHQRNNRSNNNNSSNVEVKVEPIEVHSRGANKFALLGTSYQRNNSTGEDAEMKQSLPAPNKNMTMTMNMNYNPLLLYQLVDSCVPSGGFAHSNTLEAAQQLYLLDQDGGGTGTSRTRALYGHTWDVILQTFTSTLPFLLSACNLFRIQNANSPEGVASVSKDVIDRWEAIDSALRATMTSHVASRASSTQGSGMLRAFSHAFPHMAVVIKAMKRRVLRVDASLANCTGHAATCFGAVCGLLGIDEETCASMFLYTCARDMVNAAIRMNLIGPLEGGYVTNQLCQAIEDLIKTQLVPHLRLPLTLDVSTSTSESAQIPTATPVSHPYMNIMDISSAHQVCPLLEILSNAHDRLYTRLFNS